MLMVVPLLLIGIIVLALIARIPSGAKARRPRRSRRRSSASASTQAVIDPTLSAELPAGWTTVTVENVSIAIPPDWTRLRDESIDAALPMIFGGAEVPPPFIDYFKEHLLVNFGNWLKFEGAVILVEDTGMFFTDPDLIHDRLVSIYVSASTPFQIQPLQLVQLPTGQAYLAEGTASLSRNDVNVLLSYLLVRGSKWYEINFAFLTAERRIAEQSVIDQMMQSLRISDEATEAATEEATEAAP